MGGRPTRPILYDATARKTRVVDGYIYCEDDDGVDRGDYEDSYLSLHWELQDERVVPELEEWLKFRRLRQRGCWTQPRKEVAEEAKLKPLWQRLLGVIQKPSSEDAEKELKDWKDSRDARQRAYESMQGQGAAKDADPQQQEHEREERFTASLKLLKDWREFRTYRELKVNLEWEGIQLCGSQLYLIHQELDEAESEDKRKELDGRRRKILEKNYTLQDHLGRTGKRLRKKELLLKRVRQQLPAILSECIDSTSGSPLFRCRLKESYELAVRQLYDTLIEMGGRPSRPIQPAPSALKSKRTDKFLHVLRHWDDEYLFFEHELDVWKKFRKWQQQNRENPQGNEMQENAEPERSDQRFPESLTKLNDWKEFQAYQQQQVDRARNGVDAWQRELELGKQKARKTFETFRQEKVIEAKCSHEYRQRALESALARGRLDEAENRLKHKTYEEELDLQRIMIDDARKKLEAVGNMETISAYDRYKGRCAYEIKSAQENLEHAQKQLHAEKSRLEWIKQQLPAIATEFIAVPSAGEVLLTGHWKEAAAVRPDPIILKNARPTVRGRRRHSSDKSCPTTHSIFGPVHSSKVPKARGRKSTQLHRQSSITKGAVNMDCISNQKLRPGVDIAPRRSERIAERKGREQLGLLEPNAVIGSRTNVPFSSIYTALRRSKRLSERQKRSTTVTSGPAARLGRQGLTNQVDIERRSTVNRARVTGTSGISKKRTRSWKVAKGR